MEISISNRNNVLYHARRVIIAYLDQLTELLSSKSSSSTSSATYSSSLDLSIQLNADKEDDRKTLIELVIMYSSVLPVNLQIPYLAKFLHENITDTNEKKLSIEYAHNYGLNIIAILHLVVEFSITSIITSYSPSSFTDLISMDDLKSTSSIHLSYLQHISSEERLKIRSVEWLIFSITIISESQDLQDEQKKEQVDQLAKLTLVMTNSLSRSFFRNFSLFLFKFLVLRKLEAVEELFTNVLGDAIFDILGDSLASNTSTINANSSTQSLELIGEDGRPFSLLIHYDSEMKEYLCYKAYLNALHSFAQWHTIHFSAPSQPIAPV